MQAKKFKRKVEERLDALYAELPTVDCQGHCAQACGPITMTPAEWRRLNDASTAVPSIDGNFHCTLLTKEGRCSVYEVRPLICRMFGVARGLECPWGCEPTRWLSLEEGMRVMARASKIDGRNGMVSTGRATKEQVATLNRDTVKRILGGEL